MDSSLFLILGGARSGKSTFAEKKIKKYGEKILYLATAQSFDTEMQDRIKNHQKNRPANWDTIEEPLNIIQVLKEQKGKYEAILLDCLTLFISNLLLSNSKLNFETENYNLDYLAKHTPEITNKILTIITEFAKIGNSYSCPILVVSNEVGAGIVPNDILSRVYRDLIGKANQILTSFSQETYLIIAGIPLPLKKLQKLLK